MPAVVGSIPDSKTGPLVDYIVKTRQVIGARTLGYNQLLLCLLVARLEGTASR